MPPVFSSPVATIIHCGASGAALGVFHLTGGRLRCTHLAVESFPVSAAGEDGWLEHTTAALRTLNAGRKWPGSVVLVLPAHLTLTRQIKAPRVEPAKRAQVIRFEAEQAIPHALAEVIWDCVAAGQRDTEDDIWLVAVKREIADQICLAAQTAGFEPDRILPPAPVTLAAFHLVRPGHAQPALILNVGGRSTTLIQMDAARFAARTLALGDTSITQPVAEDQDCDPVEAERIKLSERNASLVADAVQAFASRLAQEISRSVGHFARESGLASPNRVFLAGGGTRLAGLGEALAARLKIPVEHFEAGCAVEMSQGLAVDETAPLMPTDLVGAAAIVLQPDQPAVDLLPPGLRQRASRRRRQPWLIAAALLAVAAWAPPIAHYRQVTAAARAEIVSLENALVPLRAREARVRTNRAQWEQITARVTELQSLYDRRTGWLQLLAGLQERLAGVGDVWLEELQPIPPANGAPMKLAVSGRMLDRTDRRVANSRETFGRVKDLLASFVDVPEVAAVESERFDHSQPGFLRFDFVLALNPAHPL